MSYMLILLFPFPRHPFIATEGFSSPHHLNPLPQELVIFCRCWTQHVSFWRHLCSGHSSQWSLCRLQTSCVGFRSGADIHALGFPQIFQVLTQLLSCQCHTSMHVILLLSHMDLGPELLWLFFFYVLTSLGKALGNTVPKWIWVLPHCFSHFNLSQYYEAYWILSNWSLFAFILFFSFSLEGGVWNLNL